MPIYEYRCENGHNFEAFQSMSDDALDSCEVCEAPAERVLSAPAVHFKGSGFYTTDYARKGKASAASAGGGGSDDSSGSDGSSGSGESKSEGKSSDSGSKTEKAASSSSGSSSSGSD